MSSEECLMVSVPATAANLGPGFDCLGMALNLRNECFVSRQESGFSVTIEGEGRDILSQDEHNMVVRVIRLTAAELGAVLPGLRLRFVNRIPVTRGLGSSAAAVIMGIVAANAMLGGQLAAGDILRLAVRIERHIDNCAAALLGGVVVAALEDDQVHCVRLDPPAEIRAVVAVPDFSLSTAQSRRVLPRQVSLEHAVFNLGRLGLLVGAFSTGRLELLRTAMQDRLHQEYRKKFIPGMDDTFTFIMEAGALGVCLSGSGPTLLALAKQEHAENVAEAFTTAYRRLKLNASVSILQPDFNGAIVRAVPGSEEKR
ncbi:MAG: homoserine kinase [Bacillota bacterium]